MPGADQAVLFIPFTPPACPGDTNDDGDVGVPDLIELLGSWGDCPVGKIDCPADFDGNCVVDVTDLLTLIGRWGSCTAEAGAPPEQLPQSVNDCLNMFSDPYTQCLCIAKLCQSGVIPPEDCPQILSCD